MARGMNPRSDWQSGLFLSWKYLWLIALLSCSCGLTILSLQAQPPLPAKDESLQTSDLPQSSAPDNPGNRSPDKTGSPVAPLLASAESAEGPFLPENKTVVP